MVCRFSILVVLILGLLASIADSIRFDLESGHTKCIAEDIKPNSMTVGKYSIVNPNEAQGSFPEVHHPLPESHKLTVRMMGSEHQQAHLYASLEDMEPELRLLQRAASQNSKYRTPTEQVTATSGNSYHHADHVESGQFSFHAAEAGDYMACFWAVDHKPSTIMTVDFDWKSGVAAKDWSNVAKKGSVDAMELEVKRLYETVTAVHEEMFSLREREAEMQELNRATNSKMGWLSLLSLLVCLSVSGLQLWHLKSFFEKKKLI